MARTAASQRRDEVDMSGPPPLPTKLKLLRGNPGHRRLNLNEPEPPALPACPEPPAFITGYAAEEWRRAAPDLHAIGLLRGVDVMLLAAYAQHVATWRTAVEALARNPGLLVKGPDGAARRNPLIKIAADASLAMLRFALWHGGGGAVADRGGVDAARRDALEMAGTPCMNARDGAFWDKLMPVIGPLSDRQRTLAFAHVAEAVRGKDMVTDAEVDALLTELRSRFCKPLS
jgi:P27 family predicted phage terminase small subunit